MTAPDDPGDERPLEELLPYLMNRLVNRLNQNLSARLRREGLTFQHWRVLLVLATRGPRNLSELAEDTLIPQSTLSRLVMRMAEDGHLRREIDGDDSRVLNVDIEPKGREAFDRAYPLGLDEYRRAVAPLSPEEERLFAGLLTRMVQRVCGSVTPVDRRKR